MHHNNSGAKEHVEAYRLHSLHGEYFGRMLSEAYFHIDNLRKAIGILPGIDAEGHSECPVAEPVYRQKEESHYEVEKSREGFSQFLSIVNEEMARCKKNIQILEQGRGRTQTCPVHKHYQDDIADHGKQLERTREQEAQLNEAISVMDEVLTESSQRRFPGMPTEKENVEKDRAKKASEAIRKRGQLEKVAIQHGETMSPEARKYLGDAEDILRKAGPLTRQKL